MFIQKSVLHLFLANNKPLLTAFGGVDDDFQGQTCLADEGFLHANHYCNRHPTRPPCLAGEGLLHANHHCNRHPTRPPCLAVEGLLHANHYCNRYLARPPCLAGEGLLHANHHCNRHSTWPPCLAGERIVAYKSLLTSSPYMAALSCRRRVVAWLWPRIFTFSCPCLFAFLVLAI